ncbi:MAG: glycoside hydrolase family 32 protein [bacterium]
MSKKETYRPKFHVSIPSGWCNDPNGLIWYGGKGHLFFQHYPYMPAWGTMHWAHVVTDDFIKWDYLPVALVPDEPYEVICGCCSGSAIEIDGKLVLMYTAAQPDQQRQCLAISEDGGVTFNKYENNPILKAADLSWEVSNRDFRDPRVFRKNGWYYCIAGTRILEKDRPFVWDGVRLPQVDGKNPAILVHHWNTPGIKVEPTFDDHFEVDPSMVSPSAFVSGGHHVSASSVHHVAHSPSDIPVVGGSADDFGWGNLILIRSKDMLSWEYVGKLMYRQPNIPEPFYNLNGVYECPEYLDFGEKEVVLSSPQQLPMIGHSFENVNSVLYFAGKIDFETGRMDIDDIVELDSGFDIYAPQCMTTPDGRYVMIAWKEMWDRNYPTRPEGWAGTYAIPRELTWHDNHLYQWPVRELERYRANKVETGEAALTMDTFFPEGFEGECVDFSCEIDPAGARRCGIVVFAGKEHETRIYYDAEMKTVIFDRSHGGLGLRGQEQNVETRMCDIDPEETLRFRVILDVSSAEVFINDGRYAITGNVYPDVEDTGIGFFAEGGEAKLLSAVKYDIIVE